MTDEQNLAAFWEDIRDEPAIYDRYLLFTAKLRAGDNETKLREKRRHIEIEPMTDEEILGDDLPDDPEKRLMGLLIDLRIHIYRLYADIYKYGDIKPDLDTFWQLYDLTDPYYCNPAKVNILRSKMRAANIRVGDDCYGIDYIDNDTGRVWLT